jgi:hypothetical protein
MTMYRNILITTTFMSFALFATPSMSSADNQPSKPDPENQTIEVARDGDAKKVDTQILSSKRSQYEVGDENEVGDESVDCFYEANKTNPDCSSAKPDQH